MKQLAVFYVALFLAFTAFTAAALADTWTNQTFGTAASNSNTLTLKPAAETQTINLQAGTTITVVNGQGTPVDPQPPLQISPTLGTDSTQYTITGDFGEGNQVHITKINTSGFGGEAPTGEFSNVP